MTAIRHEALDEFFNRFGKHHSVRTLTDRWQQANSKRTDEGVSNAPVELYELATAFVEKELWTTACQDATLELYQRLFREIESHIACDGNDKRFEFVVVIPVADRPQHLKNCLNSLLKLCLRFGYGGISNDRYNKVIVLIADDSKTPLNISHNKDIFEHFDQQGLKILYFGQQEQLQQLNRLTQEQKSELYRVIGDNTEKDFYHKGASITRNITYLKLNELAGENNHRLFWFIDSDQEFQVNIGNGDRNVCAINYFHRLNQTFSTTDTLVLTGKVVGDPPVSPAVMAGNFLSDVIAFLSDIAKLDPQQICRFHRQIIHQEEDASYHDMADLFGFKPATTASNYVCRLDVPHNHAHCFTDFSEKLNRFFDGEHPTRWTRYEYQDFLSSVKPARTVYTGNYVLRSEALRYFIPFSTLKLRMAGPVLGRILKSEKGRQFVSANLPMLHKRTVDVIGQSEFRPGINRENGRVDLSAEFERQFYGDVTLFTIENLVAQGQPLESVPESLVRRMLTRVEATMQQKYADQHMQIRARLGGLKSLFGNRQHWWIRTPGSQSAIANIERFIRNMEHNFGEDSPAYRMINSDSHRQKRHNEILEAIMRLPRDRANWLKALSTNQ